MLEIHRTAFRTQLCLNLNHLMLNIFFVEIKDFLNNIPKQFQSGERIMPEVRLMDRACSTGFTYA